MILATKPLLIFAVGTVSVIGVASAWRSYQSSQEKAVREADRQLLQGTPAPEGQSSRHWQPPPVPKEISSQLVILNADEYRQEISEIDRLIFETQSMTKERRNTLVKKLGALAQGMTSKSDSRFIAIEAQELRQLADYAGSRGPDAARTTLENNWMRIRNNVFDDRSWFARSAADLEPTIDGAGAPEASMCPADPFIPEEPAPAAANRVLEGRWRVKALFGDGKPTQDPELANSLWMFDRNHLFISAQNNSVSHYTFTDSGGALYLEPDPSNAGPAQEGWMNYEFEGADLKLAFYDGLGERPDRFTPPAGKHEPLFLVVMLQRVR
jgi:hypothetical protein